jgi:cytochrome c biogenesis protein CcmG, thiol:disulfide interchange protein DsbE
MLPPQHKELSQKKIIFIFIFVGALIGVTFGWITSRPPSTPSLPTQTPQPAPLISQIKPSRTPTEMFIPAQEMLIGGLAPDFTLKTLAGADIQLSSLKGKPVMINLWATWCQPCRDEMSLFEATYQKHANQGLVILAIDIPSEDTLTDIKNYVKDQKLTFPILLDDGGNVSRGEYAMLGRPTSFFIDRKGILRRIQIGQILPDQMDGYLADILP